MSHEASDVTAYSVKSKVDAGLVGSAAAVCGRNGKKAQQDAEYASPICRRLRRGHNYSSRVRHDSKRLWLRAKLAQATPNVHKEEQERERIHDGSD